MQVTCESCGRSIDQLSRSCPNCGYPQHGSDQEKMRFNLLKIDMEAWLQETGKSVKSIASMAVVFSVMGIIVLFFSFYFKENHYEIAGIFIVAGFVYLIFYLMAGKSPRRWISITLVFYLAHTIFEFSNGMIVRDFMSIQQGQGIFAFLPLLSKLFPILYVLFRLLLPLAFIKGLYYYFRMGRNPKLARYVIDGEFSSTRQD